MLHPEIASRDCGDCQKFMWDHEKGIRLERGGLPIIRPENNPPACRMAKGCVKGKPESPRSLSPKNMRAYRHYKKCLAVGKFPDDPIVARNAAIIRGVEEAIERGQSHMLAGSMAVLSRLARQ